MQPPHELLPGLFHWSARHPDIHEEVHSYYFAGMPGIVIDPLTPAEGLDWFEQHQPPAHVLLTSRLHYRDAAQFAERFHAQVWCHEAGLHAFDPTAHVHGFLDRDVLPGGITAFTVGALTPEETAFLIPVDAGALSFGDAIIRNGGDALAFVPDDMMGDDPPAVRRGLRQALRRLLKQPFAHLLLAHGAPCLGEGRDLLRNFLRAPAAAHRA